MQNDMLKCAVGVIKNSLNQILIAKRPVHKAGGGFWEFPGGKIESHETSEQALIRELQEEIGITPTVFDPLLKFPHDYLQYQVFLEVFLIHQFEGEPSGREGQPLLWVDIKDLPNYPVLDANWVIIRELNKYGG